MATVLPSVFILLTKIAFCSGVTLPKTVYFDAIELTSSSLSPSKEIYLSAFVTPTRLATSATVMGLSPEIIFIATSFSLNHFIVSIASGRILSAIDIIAIAVISGNSSSCIGSKVCATSNILSPICANCSIIFDIFLGRFFDKNSGAPVAIVPISSKVTAEYFLLEEKGTILFACKVLECPKCVKRACAV